MLLPALSELLQSSSLFGVKGVGNKWMWHFSTNALPHVYLWTGTEKPKKELVVYQNPALW